MSARRQRFARVAAMLLVASACATLGSRLLAQSPPPSPHDWSARLVALDPARPVAYFELAEEVADAAVTPEERKLAETLFSLAGALDREGLGRSSALALASMTDDSLRKRRLSAVAALLADDETRDAMRGVAGAAAKSDVSPQAALALSESFSYFRLGQGPRALAALKPGEALLDRYGASLPGGADRFREDCRAFRGGLRPELTPQHFETMLAIDEAVLSGTLPASDRDWSSALLETSERPLLDVDVRNLEEAFGVDAARAYWREGRWVTSPEPASHGRDDSSLTPQPAPAQDPR